MNYNRLPLFLALVSWLGFTRWLGFAIPARWVLGFAIPLLLLTACDAGRHERMQQELATLQAMNQADSVLTNDSLAQALADYFDRHGTPNEQMEAHYLLGRTYADRGEAPAALAAYHDAIDRADTTDADCNYRQLGRVYGHMAKIFYQQNLLKEDLECLKHFIIYTWKGKDTTSVIYAYAYKIPAYERLQMYDSVVHIGDILYNEFYKKGFEINTSRYFAAVIPSVLKLGMKQKAKHFIDMYEHESGYFDSQGNIEHGREAFYNCKGVYFESINRFDSAEYYFRKELLFGKDYMNQNMASRELSCLFLKMNMPDSAAKYALYSYEMNDSVYAQMATIEVEKTHNIYNYTRHKELAIHEKERADREHLHFLYLVIIFICTGALFLFIVWKKKKEREEERKDYEKNKTMLRRLQEELESLHAKDYDTVIAQKEEEIAHLSQIIAEHEATYQGVMSKEKLTVFGESAIVKLFAEKSNFRKANSDISSTEWEELVREFSQDMPLAYSLLKGLSTLQLHVCILLLLDYEESVIANLKNTKPQTINNAKARANQKLFQSGDSASLKSNLRRIIVA